MKQLILTCALVTSASMVSFAQSNLSSTTASGTTIQSTPTAEQIADKRTKQFETQLKLTPEQTKSFYDIELNFAKQNQQMHANGEQPSQGRVMQMNAGKDNQMQRLLTPEQYATYEKSNPKTVFPGAKSN